MANLRTSKGLLWKGYWLAGDMAPHSESMSRFCHLLAVRLGLDRAFCSLILLASPLHDVGKIAIPYRILLKPGSLDAEERAVVQTHAEIGYRMLAGSGGEIVEAGGDHRQNPPRALRRRRVPARPGRIGHPGRGSDRVGGRRLRCATSDRVYRPAFTVAHAVAEMRLLRGTQFDPVVLDVFLDSLEEMLEVKGLYETRTQATASHAVGASAA